MTVVPPPPKAAPELPDVSHQPVVIYVVLVIFVIGLILGAAGKYIPKVGSLIDQITTRRRRVAVANQKAFEARFHAQQKQTTELVASLQADLAEVRAEISRRDDLIDEHMQWDRQVREAVNTVLPTEGKLPPPPPLFPRSVG